MTKLFLVLVTVLALAQAGLAIQCHSCADSDRTATCEVQKAKPKTCGINVGPNQEAVCTTQKDDKSTDNRYRRDCMIVEKGKQAPCPLGFTCSQCTKDLCNDKSAAAIGGASLGLLAFIGTIYMFLRF